jgi:hypothetical protein
LQIKNRSADHYKNAEYGRMINAGKKGLKFDQNKQPWYAMPLSVLKPLASVFAAGEKKYATFNCLQPFDDSDRRFWDATMRHLEEFQINPHAIDPETGCYHGAQAVFNILMRIHHHQPKANIVQDAVLLFQSESEAKEFSVGRIEPC